MSGDQQQGTVGAELPQPLVAKVLDANGNAVQGQSVNFRVTAGGGSVFAGTSITNADGIAQERWTLGTVAGAEQTMEARAVDNNTGAPLVFATFHATAVAGPPTALTVTVQPPSAGRIGVALSPAPAVRLVDQYANAVKQSGVSVSVSVVGDGTQSLEGNTSVPTDAQGIATFTNLSIRGSLGKVALKFSAASLTAATSAELSLTPGVPASLTAATATNLSGVAGRPLSALPAVVVKDASGNGVPNISVQFALSNGGGVISPTTGATDASGTAALTTWTLPTKAGSYFLVVSISELPNASLTFTVSAQAGAAGTIAIISGNNSAVTVGTAAPPLVVSVVDANGNPVATSVAWSVSSGSGTLAASNTLSGNDGIASDTLIAGTTTATPILIVASVPGAGLSVTFTITPVAGPPASLIKRQGDNQTASAGTALVIRPSVRVNDAHGNPTPNVHVTFAVSAGGGTVIPSDQVTDAGGIATVQDWRLGPVGGVVNSLIATVGSLSTTFTATSTNPLSVVIVAPSTNQNTSSPLTVVAQISSTVASDQLSSVTASVDGTQVNLVETSTPGTWTGSVPLQAPTGQKTLLITATDVQGNTATSSRAFGYLDAPPSLVVSAPLDQAVAHPNISVNAQCRDDSPGCRVQVLIGSTLLADAAQSVNNQFNLATLFQSGQRIQLTIRAIDVAGQTTTQARTVFVELNSHLVPVDSVGGNIQDVTTDRLLYAIGVSDAQTSGVPVIHNRLTSAEDTVQGTLLTIGFNPYRFGYLTPTGAIFAPRLKSGTQLPLSEWRNGKLVTVDAATSLPNDLRVRGNYAIWARSVGGIWTLMRRDLVTASNVTVGTNTGNWQNDVAANGDVYYWSDDTFQIFRYHNGTSTVVSHQGPNTRSFYLKSDGSVVVFSTACCMLTPALQPPFQIVMATDTGDVVLTEESSTFAQNFFSSDYGVNSGWIAFNKHNTNSSTEVWTRSPTGVENKVSDSGGGTIETVGPNGEVIYTISSRRFAVRQGGAPVDIGGSFNDSISFNQFGSGSFYMNGQFYVTIGGVLFQVSF